MSAEWDLLRDFLSVYREGSISRAAKKLGVRQSTVSRRLAELEKQVGLQLFLRNPTGVEPTDAALTFAVGAMAVEKQVLGVFRGAQDSRQDVEGLVRIAAPFGVAVQAILPALAPTYKKYPNIQVSILTGSDTLNLNRREADMALRFVQPQAGDLMAQLVATLPFAVVAHKEYRTKHRSKNPEKLDWIGFNQHFSRTPEFTWYQKHLSAPARIVCNDFDFLIEAVNRRLGVALLPQAIVSIYPNLVEVPLGLAMPSPLRLWLVMHRHLRHVPKFRVMWEALKAQAICLSDC